MISFIIVKFQFMLYFFIVSMFHSFQTLSKMTAAGCGKGSRIHQVELLQTNAAEHTDYGRTPTLRTAPF